MTKRIGFITSLDLPAAATMEKYCCGAAGPTFEVARFILSQLKFMPDISGHQRLEMVGQIVAEHPTLELARAAATKRIKGDPAQPKYPIFPPLAPMLAKSLSSAPEPLTPLPFVG